MRRAERAAIREALGALERAGCRFFACPGPQKRTVSMATCAVCYAIKRLRVVFPWLVDAPRANLKGKA